MSMLVGRALKLSFILWYLIDEGYGYGYGYGYDFD